MRLYAFQLQFISQINLPTTTNFEKRDINFYYNFITYVINLIKDLV